MNAITIVALTILHNIQNRSLGGHFVWGHGAIKNYDLPLYGHARQAKPRGQWMGGRERVDEGRKWRRSCERHVKKILEGGKKSQLS
jgi:hypothetical protein